MYNLEKKEKMVREFFFGKCNHCASADKDIETKNSRKGQRHKGR